MDRRAFLRGMAGILASGIAPAFVPSGILMPVRSVITPLFTGEFGSSSNFDVKIQWSHDGVDWVDKVDALTTVPDMPHVFLREWITVEDMQRRYGRLVVDTAVKSPIILAGTLRPQKT